MSSTYQETLDFLYSQTPQFQQIGAAAYKPGLDTVIELAARFGNPQDSLRCIHVAGTNGKGSTSHSIASVLQAAGYKVGLFTSPHLIDFRERIRINGEMIPREKVTAFVERYRAEFSDSPVKPSFFELTTVMAFDWFVESQVDFAVIEVGLGGRLDSTNIITPLLSVITNISLDHTAQLGNTLEAIASEKAGIIKPGVSVVIGEAQGPVKKVFEEKAREMHAPIRFADIEAPVKDIHTDERYISGESPMGHIEYALTGLCQMKNLQTIVTAISELRNLGVTIPDEAVIRGLRDVTSATGLAGRWMTVSHNPLIICDTGHNQGGWEYISQQLQGCGRPLVMILGFVNDKDLSHIFPMIPRTARIIYTRASVPRALPAEVLAGRAAEAGCPGSVSGSVAEALAEAKRIAAEMQAQSQPEPMIFVGGSTFVVADLLAAINPAE